MTTYAQTWTLMGGMFALMASVIGVVWRSTERNFDSLRSEMRAGFESLRNEIRTGDESLRNEMRTGFAAVETRFTSVERRLDGLDDDMKAVTDRVFRQP